MKSILRALPAPLRLRVRQRVTRLVRPVWLETLHRTTPLSAHWGLDRGTPIDRYYIEQFLHDQREDVRGHVLEVKDRRYTTAFGCGVTHSDVLDIDPANPNATIVADLAAAQHVGNEQFDCIIVTQTLQFVFDVGSAVRHLHRMLRAGGVLLVTVPSITRTDRLLRRSDYWRFTPATCTRLFGEVFGAGNVDVQSRGNVRAATAFLKGMAHEELSATDLNAEDPLFPVVVTTRAVKSQPQPMPPEERPAR
jgi:hypothetical protein